MDVIKTVKELIEELVIKQYIIRYTFYELLDEVIEALQRALAEVKDE